MMEMMRMMAAQRQQAPPIVPPSSDAARTGGASSHGELDVSAEAPPVRSVDTASTEAPRWHAQTTWVMDARDTSGLRLVICEDDATEEAEIAEARREGQAAAKHLTTLSPSASGPGAIHPTPAAPPCDLLLEAVPSAAILRATAIR